MFYELILNINDAKIRTFSEEYQSLGIFLSNLYNVEIAIWTITNGFLRY